jgi:hypothetical protein
MRYSNFMPQVTLAQSFIAQGLIKDPLFVEAAGLQKILMAQTGSYRLLGSIIADIQENHSDKLSLNDLLVKPETLETNNSVVQANMLDLTPLAQQADLLDLSDLLEQPRKLSSL